jgi:STE24 endopeptidase
VAFLVLLVLMLVCLPTRWPPPPEWLGGPGSTLATWLGVAALAGLAAWRSRCLARQLRQEPWQREKLLARCSRQRRRFVFGHIGFFLTALWALGWGATARSFVEFPTWSLPGAELCVLAPFLVALLLLWASAYDVERALQETASRPVEGNFPSRGVYIGLQARHNFILTLPPLLLLLLQQIILKLLPEELQQSEWALPVVATSLLAGVFVGIPWLLRVFLGLRSLPDGPLRERLLNTARRLHFRCNNILLWNTRHTMANAMVTGPLPFLRYVVLTDRLVRDMTPEEVEAVFGHEVGHIKHHHMLYYLGFLLLSLFVLVFAWEALLRALKHWPLSGAVDGWLAGWPQASDILMVVSVISILGGYIFVVFGFLSRRCERQADLFGCRTVSCPVFIDALEKVARLNGISRDRPGWLSSWQHSTIARRIDFIRQFNADPAVGKRFQRRVGLIKWGMAFSLGLFLWALWAVLGREEFLDVLRKL